MPDVTPMKQIPDWMGRMEKELAMFIEELDTLADALIAVTLPDVPDELPDELPEHPTLQCALAARLFVLTCMIAALRNRVTTLTNRLQL